MVSILRSRLAETLGILALLLSFGSGVRAQSFSMTHAKVELVAEQSSLQPGRKAWVGVLFDMDKGWHIYWVNPGDSGEPPKMQWQLPAGFRAGEIRWPAPVRLGTGTVIDYGYEGRVLLPLPLDVPATYKAGAPVALAADVRYLICQEVCIPAKAHLSLMLPTGKATPSEAGLFNAAQEHSPKPMPATWKAQVSDAGKNFVVTLQTGTQEAKAAFFPLDEDQIDNAAPQGVAALPTGVRITLKKSDQLLKPIAMLRGVVVFGPDRAIEISAPVTKQR